MMKYRVRLTEYAIGQMGETVAYISGYLHSPIAAQSWSDYIKKQISSLSFMPARYMLVAEEPWHTRGIRRMSVKNFLVYYYIDEETTTVWVAAVLYGRRDQLSELQKLPAIAD